MPWPGAVERVGPSVVHIEARFGARAQPVGPAERLGVRLHPDGLILTNSHVVHGASSIDVTLADGSQHPADLSATTRDRPGRDPRPCRGPGAGHAGRLQEVRVGQLVLAIGHPYGFQARSRPASSAPWAGRSGPAPAG